MLYRDFGVFVATCRGPLAEIFAQPTLYLPKMEGRFETEWWSKVFDTFASMLGIPAKVIRSTTMIEVGLCVSVRGDDHDDDDWLTGFVFGFMHLTHRPSLLVWKRMR